MQRLSNHLGINRRGAGVGCGGRSRRGVAAAASGSMHCSTIMGCVCMNHVQLSSFAGINRPSASSNRGTLLPQTSRHILSGVEGSGAHIILGDYLKIISPLEAHSRVKCVRLHRGRACGNRACAAARPLGQVWRPWRCVVACRNAISRRAWGARGPSGGVGGARLACHGPERRQGKRNFLING